MQATRTYRRISISKQLLIAVTALLAGLLIASAFFMSRPAQTVPGTAHALASQPSASQSGGVPPSKYREPSTGRSGPQLAP